MFLIDIQREQVDGVRAFLGGSRERRRPVPADSDAAGPRHRGDRPRTNLETFEDVRARGLARARVHDDLSRSPRGQRADVAGAFATGPSAEPKCRWSRGSHERFAINVGDTMRFDILGRAISARVTQHPRGRLARLARRRFHVRVQARCAGAGAADVHRAAQGAERRAARARFQHDLVEQFPNVSVIDFHEILDTVRDIMSKVTLAISVVGGLVLFSGALILIGAVAMTKFQRVYEAAVFKTLGANTRTIARMLLFEYGVLGSLAGIVGSLGAVALTWGVSRYALEIPWRSVSVRARGRRGDYGGSRRRHRRAVEPRRAAPQTARDTAGRVTAGVAVSRGATSAPCSRP